MKRPSHKPLSEHDREAIDRLRDFNALPPEGKIMELQRQLREERARAADAESESASKSSISARFVCIGAHRHSMGVDYWRFPPYYIAALPRPLRVRLAQLRIQATV